LACKRETRRATTTTTISTDPCESPHMMK
jgi:hypothetical protein